MTETRRSTITTTTDGRDPSEVRAEQERDGNRLHRSYVILTDAERARGFVRPMRRSYVHVGIAGPKHPVRDLTPEEHERYDAFGYVKFEEFPEAEVGYSGVTGRFWTKADLDRVGQGCRGVTTMAAAIAETYASQPDFYGSTYCAPCGAHFPVGEAGEFVWQGTEERVGS